MSLVVSIGGVPFSTPVFKWTESYGVQPETRVVEVPGAPLEGSRTRDEVRGNRVAEILGLGLGPHQLRIYTPGRRAETWDRVYVLDPVAGSQPGTTGVVLADERFLWERISVVRSFNVPRRTGTRVRLPGRQEVAPTVAKERYAAWSLNGTSAWTPAEALKSVLQELLTKLGSPGAVRIEASSTRKLPFEDVELAGSAQMAILRLLQYLPGWQVRLDRDGGVSVVDALDESEREVFEKTASRIQVGSGSAILTNKARTRPREVNVHFLPELELRFDYSEDNPNQTRSLNREPLLIENVAPLTDFSLSVDGQQAARGEFHRIGDASAQAGGLLWAFEQDESNPRSVLSGVAALRPLTQSALREYYFPGLEQVLQSYSLLANGAPDQVWSSRVQAIRAHWRRTFRVLPAWRDKLRSLRPYRVGVVHPRTGARALATVHTDWVVLPSVKGVLRREGQRTDKGWVMEGWAPDLKDARVAPFSVKFLDDDQMVFQILPEVDPWGESNAVVAGRVTKIPTWNMKKLSKAEALDVIALWFQTKLDASWDLSVVLTGVPAGPNNLGRYYKRAIRAADVGEGPAEGPAYDVLIGPGFMTARFGWRDDQADAIKESVFTGADLPDELLVNRTHVAAVAEAAARRVYSLYRDQVEGAYAVMLGDQDVPQGPTGNLQAITHVVTANDSGQTYAGSYLQLPPVLKEIDVEAFLPESVLRVTNKLVQP